MAIRKVRGTTGATAHPREGSETPSGVQRTNPNIQGISVNGVKYDSFGAATEDSYAYYSEILARFNNGDMSLEELYQYLANGLSGNNLSTEQREDFLKQMIDSMIAKRQLDEQRSYDNPLSQLQRLMAAGMSKDSALQALAGGAGSSGSAGSPLIGAAQSPAPSESFANEVGAKTAIANTALNALQCATTAASFGLSVPGMIANNTIQQVSAQATTQAKDALSAVNLGVNALNSCVQAGLISQDDADAASRGSRTLDEALKYCANKDPQSAAAQFIASPDYANLLSPFAPEMASRRYQQARLGDDYAVGLAHEYQMRYHAEKLSQINLETAAEELRNWGLQNEDLLLDAMIKTYNLQNIMPAQLKQILTDISSKEVNTQLTKQELSLFGLKRRNLQLNNNLLGVNALLLKNQSEESYQRYRQHKMQNDLLDESLRTDTGDNLNHVSGREWLTYGMSLRYAHEALTMSGMTTDRYLKAYNNYLQNDINFKASEALYKSIYTQGLLDTFDNMNPSTKFMMYHTNMLFSNPLTGGNGFGNAAQAGAAVGTTLLKSIPK